VVVLGEAFALAVLDVFGENAHGATGVAVGNGLENIAMLLVNSFEIGGRVAGAADRKNANEQAGFVHNL
jgi:hypothetical protein